MDNKEAAERAAATEMDRIKKSSATFTITLANGCPETGSESNLQLQDFKARVDVL